MRSRRRTAIGALSGTGPGSTYTAAPFEWMTSVVTSDFDSVASMPLGPFARYRT
jgi:hypothetical protein